jgi:hypothetical protein
VAKSAPDPTFEALCRDMLAQVVYGEGNFAGARGEAERARDLFLQAGYRPGLASVQLNLGRVSYQEGDYPGQRACSSAAWQIGAPGMNDWGSDGPSLRSPMLQSRMAGRHRRDPGSAKRCAWAGGPAIARRSSWRCWGPLASQRRVRRSLPCGWSVSSFLLGGDQLPILIYAAGDSAGMVGAGVGCPRCAGGTDGDTRWARARGGQGNRHGAQLLGTHRADTDPCSAAANQRSPIGTAFTLGGPRHEPTNHSNAPMKPFQCLEPRWVRGPRH